MQYAMLSEYGFEAGPATAVVGLVAVAVIASLLLVVFRSEVAARRIGGLADRVVTWLAGPSQDR